MRKLEGMLLIDAGKAPNPRRVKIFLAEKDLDVDRQQVDINALEQKSEAFTAINPVHTVPVLRLADGTHLSETVAICRYLEALQPEPPLFGTGAQEQAIVEMWQRRVEFGWLLPVGMAFRHRHPGAAVLEPIQVREWGDLNHKRAEAFMAMLDRELASRPYIAGEHFTIADISAIIAWQFMKPAKIALPENRPNLARWADEVQARPSVAGN